MKREDFQKFILGYISKGNYKVDLRNPDVVILIEICNDLICLAVVDSYYKNKCFNLMELASNTPKAIKTHIILEEKKINFPLVIKQNLIEKNEVMSESDEGNEEGIKLI